MPNPFEKMPEPQTDAERKFRDQAELNASLAAERQQAAAQRAADQAAGRIHEKREKSDQ